MAGCKPEFLVAFRAPDIYGGSMSFLVVQEGEEDGTYAQSTRSAVKPMSSNCSLSDGIFDVDVCIRLVAVVLAGSPLVVLVLNNKGCVGDATYVDPTCNALTWLPNSAPSEVKLTHPLYTVYTVFQGELCAV